MKLQVLGEILRTPFAALFGSYYIVISYNNLLETTKLIKTQSNQINESDKLLNSRYLVASSGCDRLNIKPQVNSWAKNPRGEGNYTCNPSRAPVESTDDYISY